MNATRAPVAAKVAQSYKSTRCLLCDSAELPLALPLKPSAIGDDYRTAPAPQPSFALNLSQCARCGNVQIEDVVHPDVLFRDYIYSTTTSPGLVEHFRRAANELVQGHAITAGALVVDIGSNDGSLLKAFCELGMRVIGVDPARAIAERATVEGVPTIPDYFTPEVAERIRDEHGPAALVTANNVFAHSDQLPAMADAIRHLIAPDGAFSFEVSYLLDIVQKGLFDTVYHEHLCYHSVRSLSGFFARHGLQLIDARRIPTKGGSLRGTVQHAAGPHPPSPEVRRLIEWEELAGLHSLGSFRALSRRIEAAGFQFTELLDRCRARGMIVAGYGASPTVTTLTHQFELAARLDFLVDDNPRKQGRFSPGHHLPVLAPAALAERDTDVVAILAWNYAAPIMAKNQSFTASGGRFAIPLPFLQVS